MVRSVHALDPFLAGPNVRDFNVVEVVVMALVVAFGVALLTWLLAGYYERRGGFGKK